MGKYENVFSKYNVKIMTMTMTMKILYLKATKQQIQLYSDINANHPQKNNLLTLETCQKHS